MGRIFGLVLMLIALYLGLTIYTQGIEGVLGGAFAPIESSQRDPVATALTPAAQMADAPSSGGRADTTSESGRRVPITEAVRQRVTSDLREGARRRGY